MRRKVLESRDEEADTKDDLEESANYDKPEVPRQVIGNGPCKYSWRHQMKQTHGDHEAAEKSRPQSFLRVDECGWLAHRIGILKRWDRRLRRTVTIR